MRPHLLTVLALLILASCGGTDPNADIKASCTVIAEDSEGQEEILAMGANTASFCDCMIGRFAAMSDEDRAKALHALDTVAARASETGQPVEDVAGMVMRAAMASPDDEDAVALMDGVRLVGRSIDDIETDFETGACPA